ncbi:MAG: hypothetical protein HYZ53_09865 [Planctomycetes bacterium]|nr:hypothetical protein [Planctomycetota bacterium]
MTQGTARQGEAGRTETPAERDFALGIEGFGYSDLHQPDRLADLSDAFDDALRAADPALAGEFAAYRAAHAAPLVPPAPPLGYAQVHPHTHPPSAPPAAPAAPPAPTPPPTPADPVAESRLLVRVAGQLGRFLARLFRIEAEHEAMLQRAEREKDLLRFRKDLVARRVPKEVHAAEVPELPALDLQVAALRKAGFPETLAETDLEVATARMATVLLDGALPAGAAAMRALAARLATDAEASQALAPLLPDPPTAADGAPARLAERLLDLLGRWVLALATDPRGRARVRGWIAFKRAEPMRFPDGLVHFERPRADLPNLMVGPAAARRRRDGFGLTDPRMEPKEILHEANYCILCHERMKDSCAKGLPLPRKPLQPTTKNPLGIPLFGCPLDERISEMHAVRRTGDNLGALALVMLDNPTCPGTGHRICNDCMKACIFQKQDPVNIPQVETRVLVDVLELPYGFELYDLLTRWNPLNPRRPHALPYNGKNVLVVGLGPAGYTLALHLLNEGFGVVGIDGLKIEPLPADLTGQDGQCPRPVRDYGEIRRRLDERVLAGFGGVAEYGITVRWDKNFLTVIYLSMARRRRFKIFGGTRFGGTLEIDDCWRFGFDHIAIGAGAGKPTIIEMKNNLLPGIRKASDFLMALQLTGAFKRDSFASLQVELPGLVIGGGLTAIDTATEMLGYSIAGVASRSPTAKAWSIPPRTA